MRLPSRKERRGSAPGATAYRRGRTYVLISQVGTPSIRQAHPPCHVRKYSASDTELGAATRDVTDAYHELGENPSDAESETWKQSILESVGVRDWSALERNAKLVQISRDESGWQLTPMRRARGYWIRWTGDDELEATRPTKLHPRVGDDELGAALRATLAGPTPTD